jgi:preprotein translocase subunit YajC
VITTSGLLATVVSISDDEVTLEIAPGVHARFVPAAIMRSNTPEPEPTEHPDASTHEVIEPAPDPEPTTDKPDEPTPGA